MLDTLRRRCVLLIVSNSISQKKLSLWANCDGRGYGTYPIVAETPVSPEIGRLAYPKVIEDL
jgi:hypothetical protein